MFHIVELESEKPIIDENGNVRVFNTFYDAKEISSHLNSTTDKVYRPKLIVDDSWKDREQKRFDNGEYKIPFWVDKYFHQIKVKDEQTGKKRLEWIYTVFPFENGINQDELEQKNVTFEYAKLMYQHYLHVSKNDSSKIAYTLNPEKGMLDVQTQKNVARYIVGDLGMDETLATYIDSIHKSKYNISEVTFIRGKDISETYMSLHNTGIASCMTRPIDYYDSFCHPTLVYEDSDISLAVIKDGNDKIIARALVWENKKLYSRIYGDYVKLRESLEMLGYNSNENFHGAKLKLIKDAEKKDRIVMPYLDGCQSFSIVNDSYIMIDDDGEYYATETNGFCKNGKVFAHCENCTDDISEQDNVMHVYFSRRHYNIWCRDCCDEHAMICSSTHEYIHQDNVRYVDGEYYAEWIVEDECNLCEYTQEYTFSNVSEVIVNENGDTENWNVDLLDDNSFVCRVDGKRYANKLMIEDLWNDSPRASFNIPDDEPKDENVNIIYRSHDVNQLNFGLAF